MSIIKVYRNGNLTVPQHNEETVRCWERFDATKPVGRAGRLDSLYASPSLEGVVHWVRNNHMLNYRVREQSLSNNELSVSDAENLYVYSVDAYDRIFCEEITSTEEYWESGIRLSDWAAVSTERDLNPRKWEVLVPIENIVSSRPVSDRRILNATESKWEKMELKRFLRYYAEFSRNETLAS